MTPSEQIDLEELALLVCGVEEADDIDALLDETLQVGFSEFCVVARALIPFTVKARIATLDNREECAQGFVHQGAFIVKRVVDCSAQ